MKLHRCKFVEYFPSVILDMSATVDSDSRSLLAVLRQTGDVEMWDVSRVVSKIATFPLGSEKGLCKLKWISDSRLVVAASSGHLYVIDVDKMVQLDKCDSYGGPVTCIAVNRSSSKIVCGCDDGSTRVFSFSDSGKLAYVSTLDKQPQAISAVEWSLFDEAVIASACLSGKISVFDSKTGRNLQTIQAKSPTGKPVQVNALAIDANRTLIVADSLGSIQFWDYEFGVKLQAIRCHIGEVSSVALETASGCLYSVGSDSKVCKLVFAKNSENGRMQSAAAHDIQKQEPLKVATYAQKYFWRQVSEVRKARLPLKSVAVSTNAASSSSIFFGGEECVLYGATTEKFFEKNCLSYLPYPCEEDIVKVCFKRSLVLVNLGDCVRIWGVLPQKLVKKTNNISPYDATQLLCIKAPNNERIMSLSVSHCGSCLLISTFYHTYAYWLDFDSKFGTINAVTRHTDAALPPSRCLRFAKNSTGFFLLNSADNEVNYFSLDTEAKKINYKHSITSEGVSANISSFDLDAKTNVIALLVKESTKVQLFDLHSKKKLHEFVPFGCRIQLVAFHPFKANIMFLAATNNFFMLYDTSLKAVANWSKHVTSGEMLPTTWMSMTSPVMGVIFDSSNASKMTVWSRTAIATVDVDYFSNASVAKNSTLNKRKIDVASSAVAPAADLNDTKYPSIKLITRYSDILSINLINPDIKLQGNSPHMLLIERPWEALVDTITANASSLYSKKFGSG